MELLIKIPKMKLKILFFALFISVSGYSQGKVSVEILNSKIADEDLIKVRLTNQTANNIWLPWDVSDFSYDMSLLDPKCSSVYSPNIILVDLIKREPIMVSIEIYWSFYGDNDFDKWKRMMKEKTDKDFILLDKGETKELEIKFKLCRYIDELFYHFYKIVDKEYNLYLSYQLKQDLMNQFIDKKIIDTLKENGYVPYFGKIESNEVPVYIE